MSFLRFLCCCGDTGQPTTSPIEPLMQNKKRISSFVCARDVKVVDDKARKTLSVPAFSCPICFLYYTNILYCDNCMNCICVFCLNQIMEKSDKLCEDMPCSFCKTTSSVFKDWEESEGKVYFDKSAGGFGKSLLEHQKEPTLPAVEPLKMVEIIEFPEDQEDTMQRLPSVAEFTQSQSHSQAQNNSYLSHPI